MQTFASTVYSLEPDSADAGRLEARESGPRPVDRIDDEQPVRGRVSDEAPILGVDGERDRCGIFSYHIISVQPVAYHGLPQGSDRPERHDS